MNRKDLHQKALNVAERYRKSEVELLDVLAELDSTKLYFDHGKNSLFSYATEIMGLSGEVACIYINVTRKAKEVPALRKEIQDGNITVSKARKITSVLTTKNQGHWLGLARRESTRKIEKEVALVSPRNAIRERANYVHQEDEIKEKTKIKESRIQLQLGLSEAQMLKLRRIQNLLSQKKRRPMGLAEALEEISDEYLKRSDPLEKAKRQKIRGNLLKTSFTCTVQKKPERKPISANIRHRIYLSSKGQCQHREKNGKKCKERRFLDFHHIKPVKDGGQNEIENLQLLCSGHHRMIHRQSN